MNGENSALPVSEGPGYLLDDRYEIDMTRAAVKLVYEHGDRSNAISNPSKIRFQIISET